MIFQEKLVANVRLRLVGKLKSDYGVHASFTAAVDFVSSMGTVVEEILSCISTAHNIR